MLFYHISMRMELLRDCLSNFFEKLSAQSLSPYLMLIPDSISGNVLPMTLLCGSVNDSLCKLKSNRWYQSRIAIQHFAGLKNSHDIVLIIGFTLGPKTHTHITDTFSLGFFHVSSIISQNNCVVKRRGCCSKNERKQRESS